jgi:single-strand DNA-binding protein
MNRAILMGRLTKEPELRQTANDISVCNFTLAVDRPYRNKDGERETDFIPITCWRQTAEFAGNWFHKGMRVAVSGSIQVRNWEDEVGNTHYITELIADEVYFADGRNEADKDTRTQSKTYKSKRY